MALVFVQQPLYTTLAAEQDIIYTINEDSTVVIDNEKVKYVAKVSVMSNYTSPVEIGVFKTTPNAAQVGIFDLGTILKNYVSPDYTGMNDTNAVSEFKGVDYSDTNYHSIHTVDRFCLGHSSTQWFQIDFTMEYLGADATKPNAVAEDSSLLVSTGFNFLFNGVVDELDPLVLTGNDFGFNLGIDYACSAATQGALSDVPTIQYARLTDYGTMGYLTNFIGFGTPTLSMTKVTIKLYNASDSLLATFDSDVSTANGGYVGVTPISETFLIYAACYPANFTGAGFSDWNTHKANCSYYTIQPYSTSTAMGKEYRVNIICDDARGFEGIRLTWLNKHGTWDYYTFNKKSIRSITTNRKTYTQLTGTWNESTFKLQGSRGGRKNYKVDSKEKIKMNTDYVSESEAVWFEQLINSPEVYILNGYQSDTGGILRRYVQPVTLTTSNYTRKTIANDKLIQYTFEVERTKNLRTQSV